MCCYLWLGSGSLATGKFNAINFPVNMPADFHKLAPPLYFSAAETRAFLGNKAFNKSVHLLNCCRGPLIFAINFVNNFPYLTNLISVFDVARKSYIRFTRSRLKMTFYIRGTIIRINLRFVGKMKINLFDVPGTAGTLLFCTEFLSQLG